MKYVIIKQEFDGITRAEPVIFSERLTHSEVAMRMRHMMAFDQPGEFSILSAGFCNIEPTSGGDACFACTSGSESLNIKKDRERSKRDENILNMPDAMQGIIL